MGLRDLFKSKSNDFTDKYEVLSKSIEQLDNSVQQLSNVEFNNKVEVLNRKLDVVNDFLSKVKMRNNLEVSNDALIKEINNLNDKVHILEKDIEHQRSVTDKAIQDKLEAEEKLKNVKDLEDIEKLRFYYKELYTFAFRNISPYTQFDQDEARYYWENLIK
jgi:hypothetical protein